MAEIETPLKSFALSVADPISLKESNSLPCKSFKELYADCELNTSFSKEKLDAKIKSDLGLLEMELFSTIQKSHEYLQQLQKAITEMINDNNVDSEERQKGKEHLVIIEETQDQFSELTKQFTKTKALQENLSGNLNMGGYRSLIICTIDTLSIIIKQLEKTSVSSNIISR